MKIPNQITIKEVGPRDGLQNEEIILPTEVKLEWIERLLNAGLTYIELTSFVSAKWIPSLADHAELVKQYERRQNVTSAVLVPNMRGLEGALHHNVDEISVFISASETHNLKNLNKSIAESLPIIKEVIGQSILAGKTVRAYISTVFGCPYEGDISLARTMGIMDVLFASGVKEISLGDTIGIANPKQVNDLLTKLLLYYSPNQLALHFHDTYGRGLANVITALQLGITTFDSSAGGLGGCPYAIGAAGNIATEDLVDLCHSQGIYTGINLEKLCEASLFIESHLSKKLRSRYLEATLLS